MKKNSCWIAIILVLITSCTQTDDAPTDNPYNGWKTDEVLYVGEDDLEINEKSIAGLHQHIFAPTCANSGCHDGNFEPDFRTIESTYNTLVNKPVIKSDPENPNFNLRVNPGDASTSMILHRLKHDILGNSGIMPLNIDPGSDWPEKKEEYITRIKNWIDDGAPNIFGTAYGATDAPPQLEGMMAFANGSSTPLNRASTYGAIAIPGGTQSVKVMFAFSDDHTAVQNFGVNTFHWSLDPTNYPQPNTKPLTVGAEFKMKGLLKDTCAYFHSVTLNINELGNPGDVVWLQAKVSDNVNDETPVPSPYALFNYKTYCALLIQ